MENTDVKLDQKSPVDKPTSNPELEASGPPKEVDGHRINYDFFFASHASPEDLKGLKERFERADVYIPEASQWTQTLKDTFREVAEGKWDVTQRLPEEESKTPFFKYGLERKRMVYNSHKPIIFADVPSGVDLEMGKLHVEPKFDGSFSDLVDSYKNTAQYLLDANKRREKYILDHLGPSIKELLEEYPHLKEKKEIRILLSLGIVHTPIYMDLKKAGFSVSRGFNTASFTFPFQVEAQRRLRSNRQIDDDLAAKMYVEMIFYSVFKRIIDNLTEDRAKQFKVMRKIVSQFNLEDAREIFNGRTRQDQKDLMETKLVAKGIMLPILEREIDEFLT